MCLLIENGKDKSEILFRNFADMWMAWLAQSDGTAVVEALDTSQDARLRLILAALILLFGIALTLIILALSRSRKSFVFSQSRTKKVQSVHEKPVFQKSDSDNQKDTPSALPSPTKILTQSPSPSSPAKSVHPKQHLSPPRTHGQTSTNQAQGSSRMGAKNENTPKVPDSHQTIPSASKPDKAEAGTVVPTPDRLKYNRPFDPEEHKKELARIDPEKKRQEILQRLAEIQKDKKNSEARASVKLPSVTAAPRPVSSRQPMQTPAPSSQNPIPKPAGQGSQPPFRQEFPPTDSSLPPKTQLPAPTVNLETAAQTAEAASPFSSAETQEKLDQPQTPPRLDYPQMPTSETEDFSTLSSIQKKLTNPPPRLAFREWLKKIEREG